MKGDFSRQTFDRTRHYRSVRMQQGRVQLDADYNEQTDITTHHAAATTADILGRCGAPEIYSAFHVVTDVKDLTAQEAKLPENVYAGTLKPGDFLLSAGHYYVDGTACENEHILAYSDQDAGDLPGAVPLAANDKGLHVVYLDVWQRHITALDDPHLREVALGGPDTATRAKTVWQVKRWFAGAAATGDCGTEFNGLTALLQPPSGKLSARPRQEQATTDPCLIPPSAGYRGLENQLYRVEVQTNGVPFDVSAAGADETPVRAFSGLNKVQIAVSFAPAAGQAVELFRPTDLMATQLAFVIGVLNVDANTVEATLSEEIVGLQLADNPRLRRVGGLLKWSRDNGSVVTAITKLNGNEVTVHDLGPDDVLGFAPDQWVEISDDRLELNGLSGSLVQIAKVTPGQAPVVTLKSTPAPWGPGGVLDPTRHPKLRRWDGAAAIKINKADPGLNWIELENGVQIQFSDGTYRAGDYWQIPARAASADAESGNLDWPTTGGLPVAQPPAGIVHHYCRLAVLQFDGAKITAIDDCRPLFPPLTDLTTLVYVGGDGQEAMPGDPLPQPIQAAVFNDRRPVKGRKVRFTTSGAGKLAANPAGLATATAVLEVTTAADGMASCAWLPDPTVLSQQVEARLLDGAGNSLPPLLHFTAQLSVASQVAYDSAQCPDLNAAHTVQQAIDLLCKRRHGGCEVVVGPGGEFPTIAEAIKALIDKKRYDVCLCLLLGDYTIGPADLLPLHVGEISTRLKIAGCGGGSLIRFDGDKVEVKGLQSLTLQALSVQFAQARIFTNCAEVVIDSCHVSGLVPATEIPLQIVQAGRARLTNNQIIARGVAVSLGGADGDVLVENNVFNSPLALYGIATPGTDNHKPLTADEMAKVAAKASNHAVQFSNPGRGILQLRGNRFAGVFFSDDMLKAIRNLVGNETKLEGLYQAAFIDNNFFGTFNNELAALHLALTANSFIPPTLQGDLGFAVAQRAAFVANLGPGLNGSAMFRFAATEVVLQDALQFNVPGIPGPIKISPSNVGMRFQG
jgi:hypothetical protein